MYRTSLLLLATPDVREIRVCEAYGTCELRSRLARQMATSLPAGDPWMAYYTQSVTVLRASSPQSPSIRIAGRL